MSTAGSLAGCFGDSSSSSGTTTPTTTDATRGTTPGGEPTTTSTSTTEPTPSLRTKYDSREKFGSPGTSFDDFEDASAWNEVQGSVTADTSEAFVGSQSLHLSNNSYRSAVAVRELDSPLDVSDRDLSFALRSTTPMNVALLVYLYDADDNWAVLELRDATYRPPDVGWFRTCPGVFATSETEPDLSRVEQIKLEMGNGLKKEDEIERPVEVHVDDMRLHPRADTGYVVLNWDDGNRSYYEKAAPVHDRYDIPAVLTMPVYPEKAKEPFFMSVAELQERQKAGDEVVAHGSTNELFAELSASELDALLKRNKQWLLDNEFAGADFIVYPGNNFDKTALDVVGKYHYMGGMNQSGNVNTTGVYGFDPLVLPRTIGHDLGIAKRAVNLAAEFRQCTILNFHNFSSGNTMNVNDYEKLLAHVDATDGAEPITFSKLWELRRSAP